MLATIARVYLGSLEEAHCAYSSCVGGCMYTMTKSRLNGELLESMVVTRPAVSTPASKYAPELQATYASCVSGSADTTVGAAQYEPDATLTASAVGTLAFTVSTRICALPQEAKATACEPARKPSRRLGCRLTHGVLVVATAR